ncbi:MAG: DUF2490 domain-containing protein [Flavobacteriales bacterium]|nr:DUF2490 domain-containing protein [Flavobacteriales bacterium]
MNKLKAFLWACFLFPFLLVGQQEETGSWMMYFGSNKISNKLSIHTEIQYRSHTISPNNIEQLLLRTGLNYHFSKKAFATIGYAYVPSFIYESEQKEPEAIEHRIWQQFILTNNIGRIKFEHRYRAEQRWVNESRKNRFRYRLMLFFPLNKPVIEKGTIFLGVYDEVFINSKTVFFDRNRLYGALGYQFHKTSNIQIGVMHQQLNRFGKWHLQFAFFINPSLIAKK